ncbi:acyltransferase family protein [Streptomyces sp. L7]
MNPPRRGWLDALRGIAALVVVFDHSSYAFMAEFRRELMPQFNTSRYAIMLFFLVSGYIIPASLERRGCVRTFWIGRVFRVYPLLAVAVAALLALQLAGCAEIRTDFGRQSAAAVVAAHVTLLQELLGTPSLLLVLWTLSYEMAFYLLVVALFTVRLHQRSATVAVTLAALAVVSATAGVRCPPPPCPARSAPAHWSRSPRSPWWPPSAVRAPGHPRCACSGSAGRGAGAGPGRSQRHGPHVGGAGDPRRHVPRQRRPPGRERSERLAARARTAAVVVACAVGSAVWNGGGSGGPGGAQFTRRGWVVAFLLAVLTFGTGLALRRRRVPHWLTWLGTISYSVYLVHPVLLAVTDGTIGRLRHDSPVAELAFVAVLLPLCALTYRYVEVPGRRWGRRLARRVEPPRGALAPAGPERVRAPGR